MAEQQEEQERVSDEIADAGSEPEPSKHELPDEETCRALLKRMMLIRRFEEEAGRQYQRAKAGGFLHLAVGEEATIVGTTSVMADEDYLIGTYRTHGHVLARGADPNNVMAELFGRVDGLSRGRGGSMHMFDLENRFMGGFGIVGGNLPLSIGLALAQDYKQEDGATVCMFGDGASNTGNFGETMNLAALWSLPIVFIVENNLYGMGTSVERHSAVTDLSVKAKGYGIAGERIDGMDVLAVRESVTESLRIAKEERRPTLIEAFTYRFRGHSAADPEVYREKDEVEEWRKRDPIESFTDRLKDEDVISDDDIDELSEELDEQVEEAVSFADDSELPDLDSLYDDLYIVDEDHEAWYALDERSPGAHRGEREGEGDEQDQTAEELAESGAEEAGGGDDEHTGDEDESGDPEDGEGDSDSDEGTDSEAEDSGDDDGDSDEGDEASEEDDAGNGDADESSDDAGDGEDDGGEDSEDDDEEDGA